MFSAAEETLLYTTAEDVDATVEFQRVGFWSRAVRFDQEGEEEAAAGVGDDCFGEFHFVASVAVFEFLFA